MGSWIIGVVMALLSMAGLFVASRAHDQMVSNVGFLLVVLGLVVIFGLIAKNTGQPERGHDR